MVLIAVGAFAVLCAAALLVARGMYLAFGKTLLDFEFDDVDDDDTLDIELQRLLDEEKE